MSEESKTRVYNLKYDEDIDVDIHKWLNNLPRARKGEIVRMALRHYMQLTSASESPLVLPTSNPNQGNLDRNERGLKDRNKNKKSANSAALGEEFE